MRYKLNFEITIINKATILNQAIEFTNECFHAKQPYASHAYDVVFEASEEPTKEKVDTIVKLLWQAAGENEHPEIEIIDVKYQSCEAIIE